MAIDDIKSQLKVQLAGAEPEEEPAVVSNATRPTLFQRAYRARIAGFVREFSTLVGAGFSVVRALDVIGHNVRKPHLADTIRQVRDRIDAGSPVHRALAEHPWYFDTVVVNIIRAAEESSRLAEGLEYVAEMLEEDNQIRSKTGNALAYPLVLLSLGFIVVFIMLFFVVPRFSTVIVEAGGELTGVAGVIATLSRFVTSPIGLILMIALMVGPFFLLAGFRRARREQFDTLMGAIPYLGRMMMLGELTRVATMMRLMTMSGVPIRNSILLAQGAVTNTYVRNALGAMAESAEAGKSLAEPLHAYGALPYVFPEMIAVGEEAGRLSDMLEHLAAVMRAKLSDAVERAPVVLQPLLLILIGGMVVLIFVSYFFPYFSLLTSLSQVQ